MTRISSGGQQDATCSEAKQRFVESSWMLDGEIDAGVSGGGVSIVGIDVEDFSFKFLVGGTYSTETTDSVGTRDAWSIGHQGWMGRVRHPPCGQDDQPVHLLDLLPAAPRPSVSIRSDAWPATGPNYWTYVLTSKPWWLLGSTIWSGVADTINGCRGRVVAANRQKLAAPGLP